jgi:hypothetical protein
MFITLDQTETIVHCNEFLFLDVMPLRVNMMDIEELVRSTASHNQQQGQELEAETAAASSPEMIMSKRGPSTCINSCLGGGQTFVRCKSMCH